MNKLIITVLLSHLFIGFQGTASAVELTDSARSEGVIPNHKKQWLGAIYWGRNLKCSVSLIHPDFVLTAEHCIATNRSTIKYDHIGEERTVERVCKLCPDNQCDIMVLKLDEPITSTKPIDINIWEGMNAEPNGTLYSMGTPDHKRTMLFFKAAEPDASLQCGDGYPDANLRMRSDDGFICPKDSGGAFTVTTDKQEQQVGLLCHRCRKPGNNDSCTATGRFQPFSKAHVKKINSTIRQLMTGENPTIPAHCK